MKDYEGYNLCPGLLAIRFISLPLNFSFFFIFSFCPVRFLLLLLFVQHFEFFHFFILPGIDLFLCSSLRTSYWFRVLEGLKVICAPLMLKGLFGIDGIYHVLRMRFMYL